MKNNCFKKILFIMLLLVFILMVLTVKSNAASLSISTSKKTVSPGETFTVTVTLNNGAGSVTADGQTQWLDNSSFSYTKTAGDSGSINISASGTVADYTTEKDQTVSASATVSIVVPTTEKPTDNGNSNNSNNSNNTNNTPTQPKPVEVVKSKINTLSSIEIEGQQLLPEFSADVKEYTVKVPYDITSVNIKAEPKDSKATVKIEEIEELKEGENKVTITVTAENGSKAEYVITIIRARQPLALKKLVVKYTTKEEEIVELPLNPIFDASTLEYSLEDVEYWVNSLLIETEANLEGTLIEVKGADELQTGENVITITAKIKSEEEVEEGQEPKEETITYTIKVNKLPVPTFMEKVKNNFKSVIGSISTWYNNNQEKIVLYALCASIVALVILSLYIIVDYKKYKTLIAKLKTLEEINSEEPARENINVTNTEMENEENTKNNKLKNGKHF